MLDTHLELLHADDTLPTELLVTCCKGNTATHSLQLPVQPLDLQWRLGQQWGAKNSARCCGYAQTLMYIYAHASVT